MMNHKKRCLRMSLAGAFIVLIAFFSANSSCAYAFEYKPSDFLIQRYHIDMQRAPKTIGETIATALKTIYVVHL